MLYFETVSMVKDHAHLHFMEKTRALRWRARMGAIDTQTHFTAHDLSPRNTKEVVAMRAVYTPATTAHAAPSGTKPD